MKKLLVLSLVLAVAGLANASLTIAYDGSKVSVGDTEALVGGINAGIGIIGPAVVSGDLVLRTAGIPAASPAVYLYSGAEVTDPSVGMPYTGGWVNLVWGDAVLEPNPAGFWFSMPLAGNFAPGTAENHVIQVDVTDGSGVAFGTLYLTPEPMTMLLLGLGGLFLRKK